MRWQQEHVERLVRPVPLREREKDRLREELWGHLDSLYQEERALGSAPSDAQRASCEKLGLPEDLARAFGGRAGPGDWIDRLIFDTGNQPAPDAVTGARRTFRAMVLSSMALFAIALMATRLPGMTWGAALLTWITLTMLLAPTAGFIHLFVRANSRFTNPATRPVSTCLLGCGACCGAAWLAGLCAALLLSASLQRGDLLPVFHVFSGEVYVPACLLLPGTGIALGGAVGWRERRDQHLPDWPYQDADAVQR